MCVFLSLKRRDNPIRYGIGTLCRLFVQLYSFQLYVYTKSHLYMFVCYLGYLSSCTILICICTTDLTCTALRFLNARVHTIYHLYLYVWQFFLFRLSVQLYGFELHVYNRSHLYKDLEEKFGLEPGILPRQESTVKQVWRGCRTLKQNFNCEGNGAVRR